MPAHRHRAGKVGDSSGKPGYASRLENTFQGKNMRHIRYIILIIAMFLSPASGFSIEFDHQGTIDRLDLKRGEIVVADQYFVLSSNLRVYSTSGAPLSAKSLQEGMTIGVYSARDSDPPSIAGIVIFSVK